MTSTTPTTGAPETLSAALPVVVAPAALAIAKSAKAWDETARRIGAVPLAVAAIAEAQTALAERLSIVADLAAVTKAAQAFEASRKSVQRAAQALAEQEARDLDELLAQSENLRDELADVLDRSTAEGMRTLTRYGLRGERWAIVRLLERAAHGNRFARRVLDLANRLRVLLSRLRVQVARTALRARALLALVRVALVSALARRLTLRPSPAPLLWSLTPCAP